MWLFGSKKKTVAAGPSCHGTARLGDLEDAKKAGNLKGEGGLGLGYIHEKKVLNGFEEALEPAGKGFKGGFKALFRVHDQHVLTAAPTGAGKGIGCVIPNLLRYPGSAVVLDLKGEAFSVCGRRRRELGQAVHVIDPFGITSGSGSSVNWIDWIDLDDPEVVSEAASLADTLVVRSGRGDTYRDDAASIPLQGLIGPEVHLRCKVAA